MLITKNNYDLELSYQTAINEKLNYEFIDVLSKIKDNLGLDFFNITTVGNSISSGYSKCDEIKPLIMRNGLYSLTKNIKYYSFSRVRHNQDASVQSWYQNNKPEYEITKLLMEDILRKKDVYNQTYWNNDTLKNYSNLFYKDIGFRDLILNSQNSIIIYNGLTGIFTDIFRNASTMQAIKKVFTCFRDDLVSARELCNQIYTDNPSIQIYFCGIPNIMGISYVHNYNYQLMKLCKKTPNLTYVPSAVRNILFNMEGQKVFDIHYNKPEYLCLLNNIMQTILDNYTSNLLISELISKLHNYHLYIESECANAVGSEEEIAKIIIEIKEQYQFLFKENEKGFWLAMEKVIKFYNDNYLPMFCCTPKEATIKQLNLQKNVRKG